MEKDNANPTILSTSDLPTRQRKAAGASSARRNGLLSTAPLCRPPYLDSPIYGSSDEFSESDGEFTSEPIDELEIFGMVNLIKFPTHTFSVCVTDADST